MGSSDDKSAELLQGTLDLLILKALTSGEMHGYEVAEWIHATSDEALSVEEGALYPALHRLELRRMAHMECSSIVFDGSGRSRLVSAQRSAIDEGLIDGRPDW